MNATPRSVPNRTHRHENITTSQAERICLGASDLELALMSQHGRWPVLRTVAMRIITERRSRFLGATRVAT